MLHCPYCHGHEVGGRRLGVIGGTPGAVRYAQIVRQWTFDLVYFTPPDLLTAVERTQLHARGICVVEGTIDQLVVGDTDQLRGAALQDDLVIPIDALFVPPRFVPNSELVIALGCDVGADGWVTVDPTGRASVPGVWAAGNIVDPRAQVITAAGRAPLRPSRSTPTWSRRTCTTRSANSPMDSPPTDHHADPRELWDAPWC